MYILHFGVTRVFIVYNGDEGETNQFCFLTKRSEVRTEFLCTKFNYYFTSFLALEFQPDDALVYKRRADARGKLGQTQPAIEDYRRAIYLQGRSRHH